MPLGSGGGGQPPSGVGGGGDCYGAPPTSSGGGPGAPMQNGAYSWVGPPAALSQKSWPPGYQASLTNLFLKKNPLHFGTGISQLAAASSYLEKMSTLGAAAEHHHKCPHPDAKDKPYPCDLCHKYLTICNTLRDQQQPRPSHGAGPGGAPPPGVGGGPPPLGAALGGPAERKGGGPLLGSSASAQQPPPGQQQQQQQQQGAAALTPASLLERTNGHGHHHHHGAHHGAAAAGGHGGAPRPRPPPTKQFLCPVCHKYFTQKGNLKTHMMIHTGEKPYSCQVCGKSFTQKGNVDTHMKIHTGEKDFGCEACGKRFAQKGNLKTHVRSVHTKEKPFACGVCGKCFSQKGNMQTHMRTHNKEDRFPCTLCGKTFSQKGNLKTHMQRHTGQLPPRRYGSRGSRATQAVTGGLLHRPHLAAAAAAFASLASTSAQQQQQQQQPGSSSPKPHTGGDKSPARGSGPPTPLSPDLRRGPSEDTSPGPPGGPDPPRPFYSAPPTPAPPPPHSPRWLVHPRHYDGGFQAPPYPSSLHHPPLASRLALLGAGSPQHQPHSGAPSPDDKAPSQHLGSTGNPSGGDSFHSPANPDFSQLLE